MNKRKTSGTQPSCTLACTKTLKFLTDEQLDGNTSLLTGFRNVDGYRHFNLFVQFTQAAHDEPPVEGGVAFAFGGGRLSSRVLTNLDEISGQPQVPHFVRVSGEGAWHGIPAGISSFAFRIPIMGPYAAASVLNRAPFVRTVSAWAYVTS